MKTLLGNPFQITSPENLSADIMVDLFVDEFTDFKQIIDPGHVFLSGPRGVGKSMMFRYLQPDCQCLAKQCKLSELDFLGIYIPLKQTDYSITEFQRFVQQNHAATFWNEHMMVIHFCLMVFDNILSLKDNLNDLSMDDLTSYYLNIFKPLYELGGNTISSDTITHTHTPFDFFSSLKSIMLYDYRSTRQYIKKLSYSKDIVPYSGALYDYIDFLYPILCGLREIDGFPSGPIYLLIDDAQRLSEIQTKVLNSWVATRTSRDVSIKISTQYNYKSYYTSVGEQIDVPHDYSEIDMSTIYTVSYKSKYRSRIVSILKKRFKAAEIDVSPEDFFPADQEQEKEIHKIAESYRLKADAGEGRGYYRNDDALRYARPDFIKSLSGTRKASSKYSYSGFDQLVHISSGVIRHFLEPAHHMYAKVASENEGKEILSITPQIQNEIIREQANRFLFNDLDKLKKGEKDIPIPVEDIEKLSNLIQGLGGLFRQILITENRSERRVYSIAISDALSEGSLRILELGVQLGYFHKSTIGRKDSISGGRTRLYVMNRFLAPIWNLDPTGFAGYLFMQNEIIEKAMIDPRKLLGRIRRSGLPDSIEFTQLSLFDENDNRIPLEIGDNENE